MNGIADIFLENPLATAFGAMGLLCQLIWPLFRARRAIISAQFGIGADFSIHYALLDAWSGAWVAGLGASQSALVFLLGDRPWMRWAGLAFLPIVVVVCYATWSGFSTLFAFAAVTLTMAGRLQSDTLRLRILLLAAAPFGMGHDILVCAAPALVGAIVSATIAAAMLVREVKSRRQAAMVEATPPPRLTLRMAI